MRTGRVVSGLALLAGLGLLAWAAIRGDLSVHLFVIVPVVSGSSGPAALGMLLVMGGLVGWLLMGSPGRGRAPGGSQPSTRPPPGEQASEGSGPPPSDETGRDTRGGGIILLGPIPIAWGSDRESLLGVVVAAIVLILVAAGVLYYLSL